MPSLSPRTQQMQTDQNAGPEQASAMFEQGFSSMAYNSLLSKHPDLMESVVTFKVLDTDVDEGKGVGAFILQRQGRALYIPVVMADNQIKPLELVYDKSLNIFFPLSTGWLDEVSKLNLEEMGKGLKTPETLYTDVDIRNLVVPPQTGRFSYAEYVENIEKNAQVPELKLLSLLTDSPNSVKLGFTSVLEKHPSLLKYAAKVYGVNALVDALRLRREKVAAKQMYGGALWIADKDTTPNEFKRVFGDRAAEAFSETRVKGYKAKDTRKGLNRAIQEQPYSHLTEPTSAGVYILFKTDGSEVPALVMPDPINVFAEGSVYGRRAVVPGHTPPTARVYPHGRPDEGDYLTRKPSERFFAILGDGTWFKACHLVGQISAADALEGKTLHKRLFENVNGMPKTGFGFWLRAAGNSIEATCPMYLHEINEGSDSVRRIKASSSEFDKDYGSKTLLTDPHAPHHTIQAPKKSQIVTLPKDFLWVPLKEQDYNKSKQFFQSPFDVNTLLTNALQGVGVKKASLKNAGQGQYSIDGRWALSKVAALRELAIRYYIPIGDAETLLEKCATERAHVRFFAATTEKLAQAQMLLTKYAADEAPKKKKKPEESAVPEEGPSEEEQAMAQQQAMQPPATPPPNPADLAAMEMQQQIETEMQKLQEKAQMLQTLTQRTQEIAGGAPVMPTVQTQMMGAPPGSTNMATGMPQQSQGMQPGSPQGMQGMPPGSPQGMQGMPPGSPQGMQGMDPASMGQQGMGMDPSMQGQDPSMQGMDPMMAQQGPQPPMPQAMMGESGPDASTIEQQINPQFLDQAAQLQQDDIFDAAAVSSLARSPLLKGLVGQYVPNLEKGLDNLGRIMLTLWMQEGDLKSDIGEEAFTQLEDRLITTFQNLGNIVLDLNRNAHILPDQGVHALS